MCADCIPTPQSQEENPSFDDRVSAAVSFLQDSGLLTPEAEQRTAVLRLLVEDLFHQWSGDVNAAS